MVIKMRKRQKLGLISVKTNSDIQKTCKKIRLQRRKIMKEQWSDRENFQSISFCKVLFKGYKTEKQIIARYKKFKAKSPA